MRDLAVLAIIFGSLPFILSRPYIGILVWSWISYMNPHRLTWSTQEFPVAAIVAVTLFLGILLSKEPKRLPWTPVTVTWLVFILWISLTTLFALVPDDAALQWKKVMKIQLISFLTLLLMQQRLRINWLVIVIVASIGFYAVKGGIFTALTGGIYTVWGPQGSFIGGNNEIGLAIIMMIPLMNYLRYIAPYKWLRMMLLGSILLSGLSVLATYSRGAFIAAGAMVIFLAWKSQKRFVFLAGILLVVPLLLTFMPERWHERMSSITEYSQDESAMGRINAWHFAFNLASDRILTGGGFETFHPDLFHHYAPDPLDIHDAHSIYFEILGEHGFIGLFLFLLLGLLAWRTAKWVVRQAHDAPDLRWAKHLAAMVQVSLVGYAVGGAFLGLAYFDFYYHLIGIIVLTRLLVERQLADRTQADKEAIDTQDPARDAGHLPAANPRP
jgi:probable O-glycosylation ligase (exosortase A-associated)